MTKVILSPFLLRYRQGMAELVDEVCRQNAIASMDYQDTKDLSPVRTEVPEVWMPGLLRPPKVELLLPDIWLEDGHLEGIIQINTSEYFGVMDVFIALEDEQGNIIESDYAMDNPYVENHWGYVPSAPLGPGTTVLVRAMAMDRLGGVSIQTERLTV